MSKLRITAIAAAIMAVSTLGGCATATSTLYNEDRIRSIMSSHFGVPESSVHISNRQPTMMGTYYNVTLPNGTVTRCYLDGNAFLMGLHNPPRCGDDIGRNPFSQ